MPHLASVSLDEIWNSAKMREKLMEGSVKLKLPINKAEHPRLTHNMRQLSYGCSPATGKSGGTEMWLLGRYIVFRLGYYWHPTKQLSTSIWAVRYESEQEALRVFASLCSVDDEPGAGEEVPRLHGGRPVTVKDLNGQPTVESLINSRYRIHRQAGVTGIVLCRARREHDSVWLVEHDGKVAAYAAHELIELPLR